MRINRRKATTKKGQVLAWLLVFFSLACVWQKENVAFPPEAPYRKGKLLVRDSFGPSSYPNWMVESEEPVVLREMLEEGDLDINVSKGITIWYARKLAGDIMIEYSATVVDREGPNDRVSDFNVFWMATDPEHPGEFFARSNWRRGVFWNYYTLNLYYAGLGGHDNTKTRFRKYHGTDNPQPEVIQEYTSMPYLIEANKTNKVAIVSYKGVVQYFYNGKKLLELQEEEPLTEGYFGFRTVNNHMKIHDFKVYQLE